MAVEGASLRLNINPKNCAADKPTFVLTGNFPQLP
jgi:hypothetical protein